MESHSGSHSCCHWHHIRTAVYISESIYIHTCAMPSALHTSALKSPTIKPLPTSTNLGGAAGRGTAGEVLGTVLGEELGAVLGLVLGEVLGAVLGEVL
jgi:hypothetical protein